MKYYIKEPEWEQIYKVLKRIKGLHRNCPKDLRRFIEGVFYSVRTGCQWRLLPDCYGEWRAVQSRFKSWSDRGGWEYLFNSLQKDPDFEHLMIDGTIVRAHACSAGLCCKNPQSRIYRILIP